MPAQARTTVSNQQLAQMLLGEGFAPEEVVNLVAVSQAESGGNPRAFNPNRATGDESYGLFQINMLGPMGPERRKLFGISENQQLFDPITNIRAAKAIKEKQGMEDLEHRKVLGTASPAQRMTKYLNRDVIDKCRRSMCQERAQ